MTSPVTSTSVAMKGAEETAGSAPSLFKMSGIIEPDVQLRITNLHGQVLYSATALAASNGTSISLSSLAQGLYIIELQCGGNRLYNKFTIIR